MSNLHQLTSQDAVYSACYIEDFLDYAENLPEDLQRNITHMRELDVKYQEIVDELESHHLTLKENLDSAAKKKLYLQFQRFLIKSQEISDEKLQIVQQISDLIENKSRQLDIDYKNLGVKLQCGKDQENTEPVKSDLQPERSSKRSRRQRAEAAVDLDSFHEKNEERQPSSKKSKKKKRKAKAEKERDDSPVEQPIDPDEPTYCLCQQISYGEMIGCDNDRCSIEWYHFSCVGLTTKPKGKWYCPKCRGDRPNVMKPRT